MLVGIQDDAQTVYGNPTTTFVLLRQLRTQIVRINLIWGGAPHGVANTRRPAHPQDPSDPAYDWTLYDRAARYAAQNGIQVLFTILFVPKWANGGAAKNIPPNNYNDLRNVAYAAAERYSGHYIPVNDTGDEVALPAVKKWLAWNEPNNPNWLKQSSGGQFVSPRSYARICNAIYTGVHLTNFAGEQVACGATGPRGNNQASSSRPSMSPLAFMRAARKAGMRKMDAYAHHPYYGKPTESPASTPNGGAVTLGNIRTLIALSNKLFGRKPGEPLGELVRGTRLDEEPVLTVADDVRNAAHPRGDDGRPGRQRLDHAHRRPLVARREDERVEGRVERSHVLLVAQEEGLAHDPQLVCSALEGRPIRAVADQTEGRADATLQQSLEAVQHVVGALDGGHPADPADGEPGGLDPEVAPCLRPAVRSGADALAELDPQADDDELLGRRDAQCHEVVAHLRADGDEHGRVAGEPPLEPPEESRPERPEVPVQDVPVERVHDDRGTGPPGEQRGHPPDRAGLRRVRVQDLRPLAADERSKPQRRGQIANRRDLAAELRNADDVDMETFGDERHRVLAPGERARHEGRVVAALPQACGQVGDVQGGPAHVEPRDDAQDLRRLAFRAHFGMTTR